MYRAGWPASGGVSRFVWQVLTPDWDLRRGYAGTYNRPHVQKHVQEAGSFHQIQAQTPFERLSSCFAHSIYI